MHDLRFLAWLTGGEECRSPVGLRDWARCQSAGCPVADPL